MYGKDARDRVEETQRYSHPNSKLDAAMTKFLNCFPDYLKSKRYSQERLDYDLAALDKNEEAWTEAVSNLASRWGDSRRIADQKVCTELRDLFREVLDFVGTAKEVRDAACRSQPLATIARRRALEPSQEGSRVDRTQFDRKDSLSCSRPWEWQKLGRSEKENFITDYRKHQLTRTVQGESKSRPLIDAVISSALSRELQLTPGV